MSTPENRRKGYWSSAFGAAAVLALVIAMGIASFGLYNGADDEHDDAKHQGAHGAEQGQAVDEHDDGHEDAAITDEYEAEVEGVLEITINAVEGKPWRFEPSTIEAGVGQRVKLTLVNNGQVEHDVEISSVTAEHIEVVDGAEHGGPAEAGHHDDLVVAAHANPGTVATVMFTPTVAGEYGFACTIPGHKEAGMVGTLLVVE